MKKIYLSKEFKQFNDKRSQKASRYISKSKKKSGSFGRYSRSNGAIISSHCLILHAPEMLSLVSNFNESIKFLTMLDNNTWHGRSVYVDLSSVVDISPEVILSMIALFHNCKTQNHELHVNGNAPLDPYCKEIFLHSGFYKYVSSSYSHNENTGILSIRSDELVSPIEAGEVVSFVRQIFNIQRNHMTKAVYTTIMEAMNNVREHAYTGRKNKKWWLMALPEQNKKVIHFALLDNGKGIPTTIRKKLPEYVFPNDAELIRSTVLDKNRSETRQVYRGLGLPNLKSLVDRKMIKNLIIISKNGKYFIDTDQTTVLDNQFIGTLICWDFIKEENIN